jgi:hypothetical protein
MLTHPPMKNSDTKSDAPADCVERFVRISFCGMPALIWGGLFAIFDPTIGGLCAIAGFWLGWQCTEAKTERGESDNPNTP